MAIDVLENGKILVLAFIAVGVCAIGLLRLIGKRSVVLRRRRLMAKRQKEGSSGSTADNNEGEPAINNGTRKKISVVSVLGSGGHTAEMKTLMSELFDQIVRGQDIDVQITYVSGKTDHHSLSKLADMHRHMGNIDDVRFEVLPRAREVGQSWTSSVLTSIHTLVWALGMMLHVKPDLVLINGPGTSAIVGAIGFIQQSLLGSKFGGRCRVIYVESFARVESLSLSGKLMYHIADRFLVQWEQLLRDWPLAEYYGRLC